MLQNHRSLAVRAAMASRAKLQRITTAALLAVGLAALVTQPTAQAQQGTDPLPYSAGFLTTGNFVVGAVDFTQSANPAVNNFSTGTLNISGVPPNADILAAYLYLGDDPSQQRVRPSSGRGVRRLQRQRSGYPAREKGCGSSANRRGMLRLRKCVVRADDDESRRAATPSVPKRLEGGCDGKAPRQRSSHGQAARLRKREQSS